jgi:uncharacterized protein YjeT (DUF2065 family)
MTQVFLMALGLVFVFEGLLPFLGPRLWRRLMQQMIIKNDRSLRLFGLVSMLLGLSILYLMR